MMFVYLCLVGVMFVQAAEAKTRNKTKTKAHKVTKKAVSKDKNSQLGTSFSFDAASVRGKYQMSGQGIATVEDEKVLDDLLGMRRNFKDRQTQEQSRR